MRYKKIRKILPPPAPHMVGDGFRVHNFFPSYDVIGMKGMSPFFLLDYNARGMLPPSEKPKGVGVHPHRGMETVTIAYHGRIAHHDSAGNSGIIGEGDVQWMTAGAAVLHKEYHEKEFSMKGGPFQMVQLWVNLPAKYKMTPAKYQAIENSKMGKYKLDGDRGTIEVIAGEFKGIKGPASTFSPLFLYNSKLKKGALCRFSFPDTYNAGILIIEGEARVNGSETIKENYFILFENDGADIITEAVTDSVMLVMSGEPIDEPVAAYGPFLMNTREEIQQAFEDYYNGKFGFLEE